MNEYNDVVRARTYINAEESRIDLNSGIMQRWKDDTRLAFWLRGGPQLSEELGFSD